MTTHTWVDTGSGNIGSGNVLLPDGIKAQPDPITKEVCWHSSGGIFTGNAQAISPWYELITDFRLQTISQGPMDQ